MLTSDNSLTGGRPSVAAKTGAAWFLLCSGPRAGGYNMALDEALLEGSPRLGRAVLRFYGWSEPAASFGYFQKYSEIERTTLLRPLVRRPTGGGLVPHDADWTYSLAFPASHEWYRLSAVDSYRRVHEWIAAALAKLGIRCELAAEARKSQPGQCFVGYEKWDVLWHGKKIAGAAQRRMRHGLLIQGSVQPMFALPRTDWHEAMCAAAHLEWGVEWLELVPDALVEQRALALAKEKYAQVEYTCKR